MMTCGAGSRMELIVFTLIWTSSTVISVQGFAAEYMVFGRAKVTWNEAHVRCQEAGMTLASLDRDASDYLMNLAAFDWFGNDVWDDVWIGLFDSNLEDPSLYMSGYSWQATCQPMSDFTYDDWKGGWKEGQPAATESYFCVFAEKGTGEWRSAHCSDQRAFMCQKKHEECSYKRVDPLQCFWDKMGEIHGNANSQEECENLCDDDPNCWFVEYEPGYCELYTSYSIPVCPNEVFEVFEGASKKVYARLCYKVTFNNVTFGSASTNELPAVTCSKNTNEAMTTTATPMTSSSSDQTTTATTTAATQPTTSLTMPKTPQTSTANTIGSVRYTTGSNTEARSSPLTTPPTTPRPPPKTRTSTPTTTTTTVTMTATSPGNAKENDMHATNGTTKADKITTHAQDTNRDVQEATTTHAYETTTGTVKTIMEAHESATEAHDSTKAAQGTTETTEQSSRNSREGTACDGECPVTAEGSNTNAQETNTNAQERNTSPHSSATSVGETSTKAQEPSKKAQEPTTKAREPSTKVQEPSTKAQEPTTKAQESTQDAQHSGTTSVRESSTDVQDSTTDVTRSSVVYDEEKTKRGENITHSTESIPETSLGQSSEWSRTTQAFTPEWSKTTRAIHSTVSHNPIPSTTNITTVSTQTKIASNPNTVITTQPNANTSTVFAKTAEIPKLLCRCSCRSARTLYHANVSEVLKAVEEIQKELRVDSSSLSKQRRKKESVADTRPSSTGVGILGAMVLAVVLVPIFLSDVFRCAKHILSG